MGPESMGGMWIIFPIIIIPVMLIFMYLMFVRGGRRPPWQDSERDGRESGPYREPEPYRDNPERREIGVTESPLDILSRRYASGEISKEEFDQVRQDLA